MEPHSIYLFLENHSKLRKLLREVFEEKLVCNELKNKLCIDDILVDHDLSIFDRN